MEDIRRARKAIGRAVQRYRRDTGEYVRVSDVPFSYIAGALFREFPDDEGPSMSEIVRLLEDMEQRSLGPRS